MERFQSRIPRLTRLMGPTAIRPADYARLLFESTVDDQANRQRAQSQRRSDTASLDTLFSGSVTSTTGNEVFSSDQTQDLTQGHSASSASSPPIVTHPRYGSPPPCPTTPIRRRTQGNSNVEPSSSVTQHPIVSDQSRRGQPLPPLGFRPAIASPNNDSESPSSPIISRPSIPEEAYIAPVTPTRPRRRRISAPRAPRRRRIYSTVSIDSAHPTVGDSTREDNPTGVSEAANLLQPSPLAQYSTYRNHSQANLAGRTARPARRWTVREDTPEVEGEELIYVAPTFFTHTLDELQEDNEEADHNAHQADHEFRRRTTPFTLEAQGERSEETEDYLYDLIERITGLTGFELIAPWEQNPSWDEEMPWAFGWVVPPYLRYSTMGDFGMSGGSAMWPEEEEYKSDWYGQKTRYRIIDGGGQPVDPEEDRVLMEPSKTPLKGIESPQTAYWHSGNRSGKDRGETGTPSRGYTDLDRPLRDTQILRNALNRPSETSATVSASSLRPSVRHVPPRRLSSNHLPRDGTIETKPVSKTTKEAPKKPEEKGQTPRPRGTSASPRPVHLTSREQSATPFRPVNEPKWDRRGFSLSPRPSTPVMDPGAAHRRMSLPVFKSTIKVKPVSLEDFPLRI